MKKSVLVNNTYHGFSDKKDGFDIPKTTSDQQFFSLRNPRRKKRIEDNLTCSMTIDFTKTQPTWIPSKARSAALIQKSPSINDAITQQSENVEQRICFKKKQVRPNIARNTMQSPKVSGNFWKLHLPQKHNLPHATSVPVLEIPKLGSILPKKKKWTKSDFIFIKKIGQGSYSEVFLAIQKASNFLCSIKALRKSAIKQKKHIHVVIRQLKIHHFLHHKYINQLYGEFDDEQHIYLIGEYCTDGDLHKYIKQKQKLGEQLDLLEVAQFIKQICEAVAVMHKDMLMHRDIKPENVFLTMGKCVKLGDFGWSVYNVDHGLRNTQCGTPLYLAPQLIQQHQYSQSVDIWAIGILAYELLTGQLPFKIRGTKDLGKIITQDIKFQYIDDQTARDFVKKLLEKDSKLRMQIQDVLQHPFLKNLEGTD